MRAHTRFFILGIIIIMIVVINVTISLVLGTYYCCEEVLKNVIGIVALVVNLVYVFDSYHDSQ